MGCPRSRHRDGIRRSADLLPPGMWGAEGRFRPTPCGRSPWELAQNLAVGPRSSEPGAGKAGEAGDSMERIVDAAQRSQRPAQPTEARPRF